MRLLLLLLLFDASPKGRSPSVDLAGEWTDPGIRNIIGGGTTTILIFQNGRLTVRHETTRRMNDEPKVREETRPYRVRGPVVEWGDERHSFLPFTTRTAEDREWLVYDVAVPVAKNTWYFVSGADEHRFEFDRDPWEADEGEVVINGAGTRFRKDGGEAGWRSIRFDSGVPDMILERSCGVSWGLVGRTRGYRFLRG